MRSQLTPLQFAALSLIDRQTPGYRVREGLAARGLKQSGPSFYQAMARMEDEGLVKGEYARSMVGSQPVKERVYTLTAKGRKAIDETRQFYVSTPTPARQT